MSEEIIIRINKATGEEMVEAQGYKGVKCTQDIEKILKAAGSRTLSRKSKPELQALASSQKMTR